MPITRQKRNVLVLLDRGLEQPSAMVVGLQYKDLFEKSSDYSAIYMSYKATPSSPLEKLYPLAKRMKLSRFVTKYESMRLKRHQRNVLEVASKMDVVFAVKVPFGDLYRKIKRLNKPKILTCFADGLWLPAFQPWAKDLHETLSLSDGIVCENSFMLDYAKKFCDKVFIMHDSPQLEVFDKWRALVKRDPLITTLGWIGNPVTANYLYKIYEPLEEIFSRIPNLHLRLVGAHAGVLPRFEKVNWSSVASYTQDEMAQEVLKMDIGLFPFYKNEEALARGILKATVYMSGETVTICRRFGDILNYIDDGYNGVLADSDAEWISKLDWLIRNREEREKIAKNGLDTVRARFTKKHCFKELINALENLLS